MYNKFVSLAQIQKYDTIIDQDLVSLPLLKDSPIIREVCRAGQYLVEELQKLNCPEELIVRIQYTAGQLSFGKDPWEAHQQILEDYKNNKLEYQEDTDYN